MSSTPPISNSQSGPQGPQGPHGPQDGDAPLRLTDFLNPATLQDIQDSLSCVAQLKTTILDERGEPLTQPNISDRFATRSAAIASARLKRGDAEITQPFSAPIMVNQTKIGSVVMDPGKAVPIKNSLLQRLARRVAMTPEQMRDVLDALHAEGLSQRAASVQFLYLMANAISRLCEQELQLRQRIVELTTLFNITSMISGSRGLQQILDKITRATAEALKVKACSIRLLDDNRDEMVIKSVFNLSESYLKKGPLLVPHSSIDLQALAGATIYVADMSTDSRVLYPQEARNEGIASMLCTGMIYKSRPIGVIRIYSDELHEFSDVEVKMLQSIASQAGVAIENARLQQEALEKDRLEQQVTIAAEVQRRMIPASPPKIPGLDIAALYVPCFELGGDFYDFVQLGDRSLGITVADVVGKGLPASLLMASIRAAMRAQMDIFYDLDQIIRRVNRAMCIDMRSSEFVTLWYGSLDYKARKLTYCSAGHDPAILIRDGQIQELGVGGMVIGVDPEQVYDKEEIQLQSGDVLWIYTDGVPDAMNFGGEKFGKTRMREALLKYHREPAEQICRQMLWETRRFVGLNRRTDDTTIVVLKVTD